MSGYIELIEYIFRRALLDIKSSSKFIRDAAYHFIFSEDAEWFAEVGQIDVNIFRKTIKNRFE